MGTMTPLTRFTNQSSLGSWENTHPYHLLSPSWVHFLPFPQNEACDYFQFQCELVTVCGVEIGWMSNKYLIKFLPHKGMEGVQRSVNTNEDSIMVYFWTLFASLVRAQVLATNPWDFGTISKFSTFNVFCIQHQTDIQQRNSNEVTPWLQDPQWLPTASPDSPQFLAQCGGNFTI